MIIILSPSKTKNFKNIKEYEENLFVEKKEYLKNIIINMDKEKLKKMLKYDKLDTLDYEEKIKNRAIDTYSGLVFKNLCPSNLKNLDKLYILSAYYGILRPNDGISNYRLDMNNKVVENLYDYWSNIYDYFKDEDYVLNLASKEYKKMINPINMINFEFYTKKGDEYKIQATNSKILRGKFASYILNNEVFSIDKLKEIQIDGYKYSEELSSEDTFCYIEI